MVGNGGPGDQYLARPVSTGPSSSTTLWRPNVDLNLRAFDEPPVPPSAAIGIWTGSTSVEGLSGRSSATSCAATMPTRPRSPPPAHGQRAHQLRPHQWAAGVRSARARPRSVRATSFWAATAATSSRAAAATTSSTATARSTCASACGEVRRRQRHCGSQRQRRADPRTRALQRRQHDRADLGRVRGPDQSRHNSHRARDLAVGGRPRFRHGRVFRRSGQLSDQWTPFNPARPPRPMSTGSTRSRTLSAALPVRTAPIDCRTSKGCSSPINRSSSEG